jgi:uncharacterized protein HemY
MASRPDDSKPRNRQTDGQHREEAERNRFARAIARSELGRHHWGEDAEKAFREAMARKPKHDRR